MMADIAFHLNLKEICCMCAATGRVIIKHFVLQQLMQKMCTQKLSSRHSSFYFDRELERIQERSQSLVRVPMQAQEYVKDA